MTTLTLYQKLQAWVYCTAFLRDAVEIAPNTMGCYWLYYQGELVYIGKAESGIRDRLNQHYDGTGDIGYANEIFKHRDNLFVQWKLFSTRKECQDFESFNIKVYKPQWNIKGVCYESE